jgi:hypothetical protein
MLGGNLKMRGKLFGLCALWPHQANAAEFSPPPPTFSPHFCKFREFFFPFPTGETVPHPSPKNVFCQSTRQTKNFLVHLFVVFSIR